ncbi:putative quinol monooxygenase [Paenibacillus glycanilyticus]|uniref:putative quinol monooxygenase n=1 Tax=Paenibacillus glycanilyticus TaxID=126569 RepID=UPI000FD82A12|nr:putative quinol monooxygenase [Paenibacillus glycanilyticus]
MSAVTIMALLKAKSGKEDELRSSLKKVAAPSRAEAGNVEYIVHESHDLPGQFAFYETWKDEAAVQDHLQSVHYQAYRKTIEPLLESRTIHRLRKLDLQG